MSELKNSITPIRTDKTLQERLNEVCEKHGVSTLQDLDWAFCESEKRYTKDRIEVENRICYHKYKRCLAMAQVLEHVCPITNRKAKWMDKWHKRWLELSEKFKDKEV